MQTVRNTYWGAGKGNLTAQNTRKPFGGWGSASDPAEGAYSAPTNPLVGGELGAGCPIPKNPTPHSRPFGPRLFYPHFTISSNAVEHEQFKFESHKMSTSTELRGLSLPSLCLDVGVAGS